MPNTFTTSQTYQNGTTHYQIPAVFKLKKGQEEKKTTNILRRSVIKTYLTPGFGQSSVFLAVVAEGQEGNVQLGRTLKLGKV